MVHPKRRRRKKLWYPKHTLKCILPLAIVLGFALVNRHWSRNSATHDFNHKIVIGHGQVDVRSLRSTAAGYLRYSDNRVGVDDRTLHGSNESDYVRYLIFHPPLEAAQGVGNLMNGLLAARMLAAEFERILCVSNEWKEFFVGFEELDVRCQRKFPAKTPHNSLWLLNFSKLPPNECELKSRLLDRNERILYLVANTYPRWPACNTTIMPNLEDYYRITNTLQEQLKWPSNGSPPNCVVHLRQADDELVDHRNGLDQSTLYALGRTMPKQTFLVSNQVEYFEFFYKNFGWAHPPWTGISHSALSNVHWGQVKSGQQQQTLQLWADWFTIFKAEVVYHTQSDFSKSAVMWSGKQGFVIEGINITSGSLILEEDGCARLSDVMPLNLRSDLQNCNLHPSGLDGSGYTLDLDDAIKDDV